MPPSTVKYLYSLEPVRMDFPAKQPCTNDTVCNAACSIAHSIFCTRLIRGKMHSDWFNGIEILQGGWQHGEKVGYCYPSGLEKTLCKWDIYVPLVTKGLMSGIGQQGDHVRVLRNYLVWTSRGLFLKIQLKKLAKSIQLLCVFTRYPVWV